MRITTVWMTSMSPAVVSLCHRYTWSHSASCDRVTFAVAGVPVRLKHVLHHMSTQDGHDAPIPGLRDLCPAPQGTGSSMEHGSLHDERSACRASGRVGI